MTALVVVPRVDAMLAAHRRIAEARAELEARNREEMDRLAAEAAKVKGLEKALAPWPKVALTATEMRIWMTLARAGGRPVDWRRLATALPHWTEMDPDAVWAAIRQHVCNLRAKVGAERVELVRGVGYRWREAMQRR